MYGQDFDYAFGMSGATPFQESYNAGNSSYKDLFDQKFDSFDPDSIIAGGNNKLKSGVTDIDLEENADTSFGYKQEKEATTPKIGRFF